MRVTPSPARPFGLFGAGLVAGVILFSAGTPLRASPPADPFSPVYMNVGAEGVGLFTSTPPVGLPLNLMAAALFQPEWPPVEGPPVSKSNGPHAKQPKLSPMTLEIAKLIQFQARVEPSIVRPGETVKLIVTGKPKPGFHTYPITVRSAQQLDGQLSSVEYEKSQSFQPLWPITETPDPTPKEEAGDVLLEYAGEFTWSQDILVMPETPSGRQLLHLKIKLQVCDAKGCVGPGYYPPLEVPFEVKGNSVPLTPELQSRLQGKRPEIKVVGLQQANKQQSPGSQTLWGFMLVSMGAAVLMLLTPCVFPMIPVTVSFFLKQSEKENHNALASAGVYSLTIIVVLTVAVLILGKLIVQLANDPWLNLALGAVLVYFALSLFGMYEIELPSFLARFTSAREGQGGTVGAFFMALTFTITSFTCTGPFLGPLLIAVKETQQHLSTEKLILGAFAYSATFAAPFFVLALFPRLLKALPKSGGWLNAIKVVMGFLEFAAALKFLANTDMAWNPGDPLFFTYETVLCAWIALSVACGLYLFGVFRLPHDSPNESIGVIRMLFAALFIGLAVHMVPAMWRDTPQGIIGKGLVAFLPLDTRTETDFTWHRKFEDGWKEATSDPAKVKPIFIDFTGVNCTNCRDNEKNVFTLPSVRGYLKDYVRVQLYTDTVPEKGLSATEAAEQAERNSNLQGETFGDISNPFYAIILPDSSAAPFVETPEGKFKLNGKILGTRKGKIPSNMVKDFEDFLKQPLR
jgi:thiol:disulfide interchange protein DsbD